MELGEVGKIKRNIKGRSGAEGNEKRMRREVDLEY